MKHKDKDTKEKLSEPLSKGAGLAAAEKSSGTSDVPAPPPEKVQQLIHELQVHQIEPEMQSEELHRAQQDLEVSRDKYSELYDFAPVGYFTLNQDGVILEANITAAGLLSMARTFLLGRPLARFVSEEDRNALHIHFRQLLETQAKQTCEVRLTKKDGSQISVRLDSVVLQGRNAASPTILRTAVTDITNGQRAAEALYAAELRYRGLFENARDGILILDLDTGKILDVNQYLIDMLGYSHEEFLEKYLWEVSPFRDTALNKEAFAELQQKGYIRYEDLPLETSDGRSIAVEFISNSYFINGMTFIQCNISDITERKRTEEALRKNEALLKEAERVAQLGHWELDLATGVFSWSQEVFHIFGLDPERGEVSLANHRDFIHPEYLELLNDSVTRAMTQGTPYDIELRVVRPDGSFRWLNVKGSPIRNVEGAISRLFGIAQDITDRKMAEEHLKASAESFRRLIESSPIGISIFRQGKRQYVNPAVIHMFGYEREGDILGLGVEDLYEPESGHLVKKLVTTSLEGMPVPYYQEARGMKRSGEAFDISMWMVKTEFEGYPAILTFVLDISTEKSLRAQLFQAQKMEAVGTLAGGVAHDFNNLLTVVIGFSELLLTDKDEQDPDYADLKKINKAGQKGADLVQRLLAFSRKSEVKPRPLNVNHQIEQLVKMLTRTIPKMIEIELILGDGLFLVNADPTQMDQVLMNLAMNAKDAMPDEGKLTIETENVFLDEEYCRIHLGIKPGEYILLSVSDTGHGMNQETVDHIFEPFYTTKEVGQGTGLGLAMVYGIVQQHGGQVRCYSELGFGTTFKIYLPALVSERGELETAPREAMPQGGAETILLVDDEEFVQDLGKRILERSGYTVLTAANGREALELYKRERGKIWLVILDLIMPEMGGKQCLGELLKIDPKARVLIASGFAANEQTKEALKAGARGFVGKPYNMKSMLQSVRKALDAD